MSESPTKDPGKLHSKPKIPSNSILSEGICLNLIHHKFCNMGRKGILLLLFGLILVYPLVTLFQLNQSVSDRNELHLVENKLLNYQISIWISWIFLVALGVYYKWT